LKQCLSSWPWPVLAVVCGRIGGRDVCMSSDILAQLNQQLSIWKENQTYITHQCIDAYALQLNGWLRKVEEWDGGARIGLVLLTDFMELDQHIMECSQDDGIVRDVFTGQATELFGRYAQSCVDRDFVVGCFQKLLICDHYGARTGLFSLIKELPVSDFNQLLNQTQELEAKDGQWSFALKTLLTMTATGEAEIKRRGERELMENLAALDGAVLCLSRGELEASQQLCHLKNHWYSPDLHERYRLCYSRRERFMRDIGVWQRFLEARSFETLKDLIKWREGKYKESATSYCEKLLSESGQSEEWLMSHLMENGRFEVIARWLLVNPAGMAEQGRGRLSQLADEMSKRKCYLEAIYIQRCLVEKYLVSRNSQDYALGVETLRKMAEIEVFVQDWGTIIQPEAYLAGLKERHGHKRSFWQRFTQ